MFNGVEAVKRHLYLETGSYKASTFESKKPVRLEFARAYKLSSYLLVIANEDMIMQGSLCKQEIYKVTHKPFRFHRCIYTQVETLC